MTEPVRTGSSRLRRVVTALVVTVLGVAALVLAVRPSVLGFAQSADSTPVAPSEIPVAVDHGAGAGAAPSSTGQQVMTVLPADGSRYFGVSVASPDAGEGRRKHHRLSVRMSAEIRT